MTDLFGVAGRQLLDRLEVPAPWRGTSDASILLIDDLERQIDRINRELRAGGADHPYVPLLLTVPGIGWVLAFTIAAEIGDITRFPSATNQRNKQRLGKQRGAKVAQIDIARRLRLSGSSWNFDGDPLG